MNPGKGLQWSDRSLGLCVTQSVAAPSVGRAERSTLLQGSAPCSSTAPGFSELLSSPLAVTWHVHALLARRSLPKKPTWCPDWSLAQLTPLTYLNTRETHGRCVHLARQGRVLGPRVTPISVHLPMNCLVPI